MEYILKAIKTDQKSLTFNLLEPAKTLDTNSAREKSTVCNDID